VLLQDLIRGNVEASVEDAAIVAPIKEDQLDEGRPKVTQTKARSSSRKLPEHDLSNIMPTGKRLRKSLTTIEPVIAAPVGPKPKGLPKEKKSTKDKELEKADRKQEIMVTIMFFFLLFAVNRNVYYSEANNRHAARWVGKGKTTKINPSNSTSPD